MTSQQERLTAVSARGHIVRGTIWMVVMRWAIRLIGLVSTVILARLLAPSDFGLVAMAMLFIGIVEVLGETGQQAALIRHPNPTREHFDSAWTTQVLASLVLGMVVLVGAPYASHYFSEPRTELLIQVLSIRVFLIGFENIGTVMFRKELDFAMEFRYGVYKKLLAFVTTISLAFYLRSYWALVGGVIVGEVLSVILSYRLHPYRPRFSTAKMAEIWHFSFWSWVMTVGGFIYNRIDQYVVSAFGSSALMGLYQLAVEVAKLPGDEMIRPLQRALFPTYSRLIHDPVQLRDAYLNVLSVIAIVAASTSAGMALVAPDLVLLLLGEKWVDATRFVFWLALAGGITAYSHSVFLVLSSLGRIRRAALQAWSRLLLVIPLLIYAASQYGPEGVSAAYLAGVAILAPTYFMMLRPVLPLTYGAIIGVTWRPLLSAGLMAAVLNVIPASLAGDTPVARLAFHVPLGAATFGASLLILWLLAGRPAGAERAFVRAMTSRLARRSVQQP